MRLLPYTVQGIDAADIAGERAISVSAGGRFQNLVQPGADAINATYREAS
jgi:hypothetical protein